MPRLRQLNQRDEPRPDHVTTSPTTPIRRIIGVTSLSVSTLPEPGHAGDDPEPGVVHPRDRLRAAADRQREVDRVEARDRRHDERRGDRRRGDHRHRRRALGGADQRGDRKTTESAAIARLAGPRSARARRRSRSVAAPRPNAPPAAVIRMIRPVASAACIGPADRGRLLLVLAPAHQRQRRRHRRGRRFASPNRRCSSQAKARSEGLRERRPQRDQDNRQHDRREGEHRDGGIFAPVRHRPSLRR